MHRVRHGAAVSALVLAAGLGASGCALRPQDCSRSSVRCAGLVTDFGPVDEGLSQEAWLALLDARAAGMIDRADFIETVDTRDREANITAFGEQGYDIIVTVGAGMADETIAVAQKYPDLRFIGVQQSPVVRPELSNFVALVFHEEESGFLAGAAAGLITRTDRVAAVCEVSFIDSIRRYCEGFRAGAKHVDPEIRVKVAHRTGSQELLFRDVEWSQAAAVLELDRGTDVVFAVGYDTADAALAAAAVRGALVIGAETDAYGRLPEIRPQLVTSAILDVRSGLLTLIRDIAHGWFRAGEYWGRVSLAPWHESEGRIAPEAIARLQEIASDLESGAIKVNVPFDGP
ncbi:MAG: BMP family ABC transporter substrate-binding protein [Chloroflexota bacterium]